MLEQTDAITNEVLEPITFVLAYPTVCVRRHFARYSPAPCWPQSFRFSSVWTLESPSVFSSN